MRYDIYAALVNEPGILVETHVTIDRVATVLMLDEQDVEWAISEAGRCDVGRYVAVPFGDPRPIGSYGEEA